MNILWKNTRFALPIVFIFFAIQFSTAKSSFDSICYLSQQDTIFLKMDEYGVKYFEHEIQAQQTLYSLARFHGLSLNDIYQYNPNLQPNAIALGTMIKIPVPNIAIIRYQGWDFTPEQHVPIYYVVKKGDTMYRIAKQCFRMPIDTIIARNQLHHTALNSGQLLLVGWMNTEGIPDSLRKNISFAPINKAHYAFNSEFRAKDNTLKAGIKQGVAVWQKNQHDNGKLYALHRTAPINSKLAVANPMLRRTVYVKVVGRIPNNTYDDDVVVILSPRAAKDLGAKDPRFFVQVKE